MNPHWSGQLRSADKFARNIFLSVKYRAALASGETSVLKMGVNQYRGLGQYRSTPHQVCTIFPFLNFVKISLFILAQQRAAQRRTVPCFALRCVGEPCCAALRCAVLSFEYAAPGITRSVRYQVPVCTCVLVLTLSPPRVCFYVRTLHPPC